VPALLAKLLAEDFTGAVEVAGTPGGTIHLRRGLVVAVDTPNAPSVETLLIRSGRIDEASWAGAISYQAAVAMPDGSEEGGLNPVLTELRLIGRGELEAICVAALYDAAFAMALSPAEGWTVHKGAAPPALVSLPGESPRKLADETTRRIAVLSRSWSSLGELAAARCRPAARIDPGLLTARQQAVLLAANGRRTPRDIAFFLGCGVFPAMLDVTRLRARGLVQWEVPRPTVPPSTARRAAPAQRRPDDANANSSANAAAALPRRPIRDRTTDGRGGL
jgi:hypothetical protein